MRLLLVAALALLAGCASVGVTPDYGKDSGYQIEAMSCFLMAQTAPNEIATVKYYGVDKETYLQKNYESGLESLAQEKADQAKAGKPMDAETEDKIMRFINQYLYYMGRIWDSKDGGEAVIEECMDKSPEGVEAKKQKLKPSGMTF